jgi:hypothetical protein
MHEDKSTWQNVGQDARKANDSVRHNEVDPTRRRLAKAGFASAPIIMTLTGRPVWGQTCTPSIMDSATHASHAADNSPCEIVGGTGLSPEAWKNRQCLWALTGVQYGECATTGDCNQWSDYVGGTTWAGTFGPNALLPSGTQTVSLTTPTITLGQNSPLREILGSDATPYNLASRLIAAYLNSLVVDFGYQLATDLVWEFANGYRPAGMWDEDLALYLNQTWETAPETTLVSMVGCL